MADIRTVIAALTPDIRGSFGCRFPTDSTPPLGAIPGKVSPLDGSVTRHFCAISAGGGGGVRCSQPVVVAAAAATRGGSGCGLGAVRSSQVRVLELIATGRGNVGAAWGGFPRGFSSSV